MGAFRFFIDFVEITKKADVKNETRVCQVYSFTVQGKCAIMNKNSWKGVWPCASPFTVAFFYNQVKYRSLV